MPLDLSKLKKKQLLSLISKKDEDILSLTEQINQLKLDLEQAKEENPKEIKVSSIHESEIEFYEERISNCIHKDLVKVYRKELNRILELYA